MTIKNSFLRNTKNHTVQILKDDGLYRHLKCTEDNSQVYRFDIITWPGFLTICQDMGTSVFTRVPDMFNFFRRQSLTVNTGYWAEKCCANEGGIKKFSQEIFESRLKECFESWCFRDEEQKEAVWAEVQMMVIDMAEDHEVTALYAALSYTSEFGHSFGDFWEYDITEYTYHFVWRLYAVVWAIQQYDKIKGVNND